MLFFELSGGILHSRKLGTYHTLRSKPFKYNSHATLNGSSFNVCDVIIGFPCGTGSTAVADEPGGGWRGVRALHPGPVRPRRHQVRTQGPAGGHSGTGT